MAATSFTTQQVDNAVDYVVRQGAENRAALVHYTLVFSEAGLPAPQHLHQGREPELVTRFMEAFHFRCIEREYPPLDSLVVHVAGDRGGVPGAGYFRINRQPDPYRRGATADDAAAGGRFLEQQRNECRTWGDRHRRRRSS
jgi:hypothetical protein